MEDLKPIIAQNLIDLRKKHGFTQAELAERLNYSDKAVSKWERGESVPDVAVLKEIADLFAVRIDYLLTAEHTDPSLELPKKSKYYLRNRKLITGMSVMLVWLIATFLFALLQALLPFGCRQWTVFMYALPVSLIVLLIFNSIWFNKKHNFSIISALVWSLLSVVYFALLIHTGYNAWMLFCIGVPAQIIVILWSGIRLSYKGR